MALIAAHLNAGHSGGDSVATGIMSLFPHLHTTFPPFSPSLISLMVSVDVKHHVYLLYLLTFYSFLHSVLLSAKCTASVACLLLSFIRTFGTRSPTDFNASTKCFQATLLVVLKSYLSVSVGWRLNEVCPHDISLLRESFAQTGRRPFHFTSIMLPS